MEGRRTKQTKREIRDPRLDNTHSHEEEEETDRGQRERGGTPHAYESAAPFASAALTEGEKET